MFTITIENSFTAQHRLTLPDGTKEPLHEHDWQLKVTVSSDTLDQTGCVMDFHLLESIVNNKILPLKNTILEDVGFFLSTSTNVSAENLAKYIYDSIAPELPQNVTLDSVAIMEAPNCWAKYTK